MLGSSADQYFNRTNQQESRLNVALSNLCWKYRNNWKQFKVMYKFIKCFFTNSKFYILILCPEKNALEWIFVQRLLALCKSIDVSSIFIKNRDFSNSTLMRKPHGFEISFTSSRTILYPKLCNMIWHLLQ